MPSMGYQVPVHVPLPTYNWAASDQMREFCLFKCQLKTWTRICKIKAEEKLDYLLCILGKEGYVAMDRWVPADDAHKNDPVKFLDYIESTLDDEISPGVHVNELEDITKRSDESIDELVDQIHQLICRAHSSDGSDAVTEFKVQLRLIWAIPDTDIELHKQLLKVSCDKRVSHLLEICRTYYTMESGAAAMCVGHVVHTICHTHQTHDHKLQTSYAPCPNCTHQHTPSRHNCPAWDSACKGCGKKGHWWAKCQSSRTTSLQASHHKPQFKSHKKRRYSQAAKAKTEKRPLHKDLFIAAVDCGTEGDMHPKEMITDNMSSQKCNEVCTVIKLPASASSKGTASVCVKIDTGSGGNILPLHLLQQLHPKQTSPDDLPIGLDPIQTKLTTYNGSLIPLYGILCGPIFWQPNTPGAQPCMIHSYWYIAHTPGPALLGLPACKKLAVVQVNYAVGTTQPNRSLTGTATTQAAREAKPPAARTPKPKCITSTDDLMIEFHWNWQAPRWIQDTTASRCSSSHTHTQKISNGIMSQGQGAPGKNEGPGSNHPRRPAHSQGIINNLHTKGKRWALLMSTSVWPQQSNPPQSPQDTYCRRSCTPICKFMLLHQAQCTSWILVNSPWWRIKPPNYLQQPLWEVPLPASSLWSGLFARHLPEEDGPNPQRVPWMYWDHQWHHHTWSYWGRTWCPSAEPHVGSPQVWSCVQSTEDAHKGPSCKLLWLPIWCQWCPSRPREGQCCACSPSIHKCHWTPRVPWHGDIPQPLHPWPVHSDHPPARTSEKIPTSPGKPAMRLLFSESRSCHQWHYPQILWPITACDHTSQCLTGRPWCSTSTR